MTLGLTLRQIFEKLVYKNAINPKIDNPPMRFSPKSIDLYLPGFQPYTSSTCASEIHNEEANNLFRLFLNKKFTKQLILIHLKSQVVVKIAGSVAATRKILCE